MANITYDPKYNTILEIETTGDPSVGIWPARMTIVVPFSPAMLKEDRDFAKDVKELLIKDLPTILDFPIATAFYDFEIDELADMAEDRLPA